MNIDTKIPKPIFRYHGGKWKLAPWIISHMPEHQSYVEPYCGAASVLLNKIPVREEIINDLNDRLISVFNVLRHPEKRKQLQEALRFTPYSRTEFINCSEPSSNPVEGARRMFVLSHQSYGSIGVSSDKKSGWRRGNRVNGRSTATEWLDIPDLLGQWAKRLSGVFIENMNAIQLIEQTDSEDTLFYVDPPYVLDTRSKNARGNYKFEMTQDDHAALARCLENTQGMVILSGYPSDLYDRQLFNHWQRIEKPSSTDIREVIWLSPNTTARLNKQSRQRSLFSSEPTIKLTNQQ